MFLAQEAPLASCALDHPQITDAVTNSISSDRSELPILNAASPISENHSSLPVPSPGSHPLYESPGAFVFSNSYDVYPSSDGGPASELFRSSTSSSLLSSSDLACTTCRQPMCSCTPLLTAHGCPLQCADSSKVSPLRGLIDGSASVTADSRVIDTHLMCRQFDREVPLSSCALDIASGSVPNASLEIHDGHSTVPALSPIVHSMPEFSSLDSLKTDEGKFLGELNGNVVGNVGMELNGSLEHDEEGHELEEGELSDQECSEKTASAETFQDHEESVDHEESASLDKGPSDDITRQQSSKVQGIAVANAMGSLTGIMLPRYFTRSSVRKGVAEKGHARESNKKRKSSDHHDESEKRKKTSRKKRKSEKQQGDVPKQRGSSGSWTTGKDGQQLCVQNGNKAAVGKKRECSPSVEEREHMKQKQEAVMKATVQPALPVNETVTVQEKKKGLLSMFVEGEVGLWTTDAGDDQILTTQTDMSAGKTVKRTLTAARKKAKQRAKARKKAQKEKALGIRKLRFEAPKEKVIKYCEFYIKGRCNKGAACAFSHDIIPRTKSEVCKYYINRCCLKGNECPFSHDLSSYPCKFFHMRGYCLDGDSCRFSHKPLSEEAWQDLCKRTEQERQARLESGVTSTDILSGKVESSALSLVPRETGLQKQEISSHSFDTHTSLKETHSQSYTSTDHQTEGSPAVLDLKDQARESSFFSMPQKEASESDVCTDNAVLMAARKTGFPFTYDSGTGSDSGVYRAPLLNAGTTSLDNCIVSDVRTQVVYKGGIGQPGSPGLASLFGMSGLKDPKTRAMELLKASLETSQLLSRPKSAVGTENPSDHQKQLPKNDENAGSITDGGLKTSDSYNPSITKHLQTSEANKDQVSENQSLFSRSNLLSGLFRVNSDAPSPNQRPTVDNLLSKILLG